MRVGLFVPCFVDLFYPRAAEATVRLLERLGVTVDYPAEQTCCGQAPFNAGRRADARVLAERFCRVFERYETVVCPSGSCTAMVRMHYPSLVGDHPVTRRTFELCEFLVSELGVDDLGARLPGRAALHVGCHHRRELGGAGAAERLVASIRDLTLVRVASDPWCCGFGGTFSVKFPEISTAMGRRKLEPVLEAKLDYLLATDSSCLMHLDGLLRRAGRAAPETMHIAEALVAGVGS